MEANSKRMPIRITPCPIIEGILELRFTKKSTVSSTTLPGLLASKLNISKSNDLPSTNIPEQIASDDPHLRFVPRTQLIKDDFIIQLGPNVLSINNPGEYVGWERFSECIYSTIQSLIETDAIESISRLGLRYIDFFDNNIFENLNLNILMNGSNFFDNDLFLQFTRDIENYRSIIKISNQILMNIPSSEKPISGSTIDIDTTYIMDVPVDLDEITKIIEGAHEFEKDIFYDLISDTFLQELNPEYAE